MKKLFAVLMTIVMIISGSGSVSASTENGASERMLEFISAEDDFKQIEEHSQYMYANFAENIANDKNPELIRQLESCLGKKCTTEIPEDAYIKVLSDVILSYDLDNAADINERARQNEINKYSLYARHFENAEYDIADIIGGTKDTNSAVCTAIEGIATVYDSSDERISAVYDVETLVQDYIQYDLFLELIENASDGTLKSAASKMRTSLSAAIRNRLEKHGDILNSQSLKYGYYFMTDKVADILKEAREYLDDSCFHTFVDRSENLLSEIGDIGTEPDLGFIIEKTDGDLKAGGKDLFNRVNELRILDEISRCLSSEAVMLRNNTVAGVDEEKIGDVIFLDQILINCRIRGEYSVYSILSSDKGLLSWAGMKNDKEALDAYYRQTTALSNIEEKLKEIRFTESDVGTQSEESDDQDIIEQYKIFLCSQTHGDHYLIYDIDKDGYPELMIRKFLVGMRKYWYSVFKYEEGEFEFTDIIHIPYGEASYASYPDGNGLVETMRFRGYEDVGKITLFEDKIEKELIYVVDEKESANYYPEKYEEGFTDGLFDKSFINHQYYLGESYYPYYEDSYLLGHSAMDDFTAVYEALEDLEEEIYYEEEICYEEEVYEEEVYEEPDECEISVD